MKTKTSKEYLARSSRCPFCDSGDITGEGRAYEGDQITQVIEFRCRCNDCDRRWYDIYQLIGYEEIE